MKMIENMIAKKLGISKEELDVLQRNARPDLTMITRLAHAIQHALLNNSYGDALSLTNELVVIVKKYDVLIKSLDAKEVN